MRSFHPESDSATLPALVCSLAIAAISLFGYTEGRTIIPQAISALTVGIAVLTLANRIPSIHIAVFAFMGLLAFWAVTLIDFPEVWIRYQSLLRMSVLALAAHVIFRTPKHLLLLFGVYSATGLIVVAFNWSELDSLGETLSGAEQLLDKDRFAGTFGNANSAGTYATTTLLLALIYFLNSRSRARWPILVSGVLGGLTVVYFTGSRKAMLALGLTALLLPWMATRIGGAAKVKWVKWLLISGITVGFCTVLFSRLPYTERLVIELREGVHAESSSDVRATMLTRAFELWKEHPFVGCGFEGFARLSGWGVYSHSTFSEVLCNGGLLGLLLLGLFYAVPGVQLAGLTFSRLHQPEGGLHIGLFALWLQIVLFSLFGVIWYSGETLCIYMAVCGYLQETYSAKTRGVLPQTTPPIGERAGPSRLIGPPSICQRSTEQR